MSISIESNRRIQSEVVEFNEVKPNKTLKSKVLVKCSEIKHNQVRFNEVADSNTLVNSVVTITP